MGSSGLVGGRLSSCKPKRQVNYEMAGSNRLKLGGLVVELVRVTVEMIQES